MARTRLTGYAGPGRPDGAHARTPISPVVPDGDGSGEYFYPAARRAPLGDERHVESLVAMAPIWVGHRVRAVVHFPSTVSVGPIWVAHRVRVVDPLPDILADEDDLMALLAAVL